MADNFNLIICIRALSGAVALSYVQNCPLPYAKDTEKKKRKTQQALKHYICGQQNLGLPAFLSPCDRNASVCYSPLRTTGL
jgi:hypothetical protein